jgi:uncharacterized membrane protein (UPF0127 family)
LSPNKKKPEQGGSRRFRPLVMGLVALAVVLAGIGWFGVDRLMGQTGNARPDKVTIETRSGQRYPFTVEWAVTPDQRAQGLMFRTQMAEDHGMIFDFGVESPQSFWMKNTPLSLDMIFIHADGTIYRIEQRTTPFSEDVVPSGAPVRYVMEVLGGVTRKLGIQAGDRLRLR